MLARAVCSAGRPEGTLKRAARKGAAHRSSLVRIMFIAVNLAASPVMAAGQTTNASTVQTNTVQQFSSLSPEDQKTLLDSYAAQKDPKSPEAAAHARRL